jgi:hypothetical protein
MAMSFLESYAILGYRRLIEGGFMYPDLPSLLTSADNPGSFHFWPHSRKSAPNREMESVWRSMAVTRGWRRQGQSIHEDLA